MQGLGLKCFGEVKSGLLHVNGCGNEYWIKKLGGSDIAHHHLSPTNRKYGYNNGDFGFSLGLLILGFDIWFSLWYTYL